MQDNNDLIEQGARLEKLYKTLGFKGKTFAEDIGVSQPLISKLVNGKGDFSHLVIKKITNRHPGVNSHWLITGEGEMFLGKPKETKPVQERVATEPGVLPTNIISIRKRWGMSQSEFAELVGVTRFVVGHWERGRNTPSYEEMTTLEHLTGYNHNTLRTRELLNAEIPAVPQAPTPDVLNPIEDIRERLERIEGLLLKLMSR